MNKLSEADLDARISERPMVERFSRGLGETQPDPRAWWTTAEAAAAHEEWIREQFREAEPLGAVWAHRIVGVVLLVLLAWLFVEWMGWAP